MPDFMTLVLPRHFDSTMRSCHASCPTKFFHEFVQGYRPKGRSIHLHAGGCFASALEDVYRFIHLDKMSFDDAILRAHAGFFQRWGDMQAPQRGGGAAKSPDRVWEAVEDYFRTYTPGTDMVQPYFAADGNPTFEYTFAIPLEPITATQEEGGFPEHPDGGPFIYVGRFDQLGQMYGRPVIKDDKTAGSIGDYWAEQWDMRGQFLGYLWACQESGIQVEEVVVRGVGILKTKIHQVEAIKTYSQHLIAKWREQLRRDLWRIRRAWDEKYWDLNFGDSCNSYGTCMFIRACTSQNPEDWLRGEFEVKHWNPLNKNPEEEKKP